MDTNKIIMIEVDKLHPHPDNPRKNIGDVSELAESLKKNGILQNLTVVPAGDGYTVIIGHRRLAAAKAAELKELPCVVAEMTPEEQFHTMLTENMQRTDLTPMEQAQGFQIMFNWGYSEKDIAEKTGFSETTVRHRLNMAKLSTKAVEKYEKDNGFQLSLSDFYALEKVPTLKEKNDILKNASSSRDIQKRAAQAEITARRDKAADKIIKILKKAFPTIKAFPEKETWDSKWEQLKSIDLDKPIPDKIPVGKAKKDEQLFYYRWYSDIGVYRKKLKEKKVESDSEKKRKEAEKRGKQITAKLKAMSVRARDLILAVIDGKIDDLPANDTEAVKDEIWKQLLAAWAVIRYDVIYEFLAGGVNNYYNLPAPERESIKQKAKKLCALHQMLINLHQQIKGETTFDYYKAYVKDKAEKIKAFYSLLERYGWSFEDDEAAILDGTHELYTKLEAERE